MTPLGADRATAIDIRVVAATHRDLAAAVADGTFREDLFYRLNVIPLHLPPLAERVADILPLAAHFLLNAAGMRALHLTNDAQRALLDRIIPEAIYKRRRDRLTRDESEKTERLVRIVATTTSVWSDESDACGFLSTPHPELEGLALLDVALSEFGARRVEELL
ncbi:sigma 54-interacting transcriptional regulator [Burkholderia contaminans]|uniref:sigma 54-interacting transcriptional regulator n=1 Tax=Burkholderia contaminans TaxID=488447 RepID=UPI002D7F256F|nr:sigma 54-interacting transcriptional regulator [Burkholderia contaminans]